MDICPNFDVFARIFREGRNQTVSTAVVSDMETPVSAMLKLGKGKPYTFLLESTDGDATRGRYSIIGREPDLIWRCERDGTVRIIRGLKWPNAPIQTKSLYQSFGAMFGRLLGRMRPHERSQGIFSTEFSTVGNSLKKDLLFQLVGCTMEDLKSATWCP